MPRAILKENYSIMAQSTLDVQLNIQSEAAISISIGHKRIPLRANICQISNYASDGGSRHRGGDKYNLHVSLTSGKREAFHPAPSHAINFRGYDAK